MKRSTMAGWKVRLGDGSEIGPMDMAALRTWLAQGLIDADSPVMPPGSRKWTPLGTVAELQGLLGSSPRPGKAASKRRGGRAPVEEDLDSFEEESPRLDRWRVVLAGALLLAAAAPLGYLAWRPREALPALDGTPWLQIALGALALGLALLPGWDVARRGVRVVLLLVAFGLFPLAGILIAQGERGAALLALASAWLFVSGLVALLARSLGWAGLAAALVPVVAGAAGTVRFGRSAEGGAAQNVREWAAADRRFTDDALGLTLEVPEGWVALRPEQTLVAAPPEARLVLAQPRHGGFAYLLTEAAPRGIATPDQYLDHVLARRRSEQADLVPGPRSNAPVGALAGRRVGASWHAGGVPQREVAVAGLDGWMGFALVAWMPEAAATRSDGLEPVVRGLAARGLLAVRLRGAVEAVVADVPHLTAPAAEQLMAQSEARVLEPDQAFRRSVAVLAKLLPSLSGDETRELTGLTAATYAGLPWAERTRLASYIERVRRGDTTPASEDREMAALMKAAELRLSPARRLRLQAYYDKAIRTAS